MIRHYLDGRLFEWTFSVGSVWLAVAVFVWPDMIILGAFRHFSTVMSTEALSTYAGIVGACSLVALSTNGTSVVVGPVIRSVCAVLRALIWGEFAYALWLLSRDQPAPSLGMGFWILFTASELYSSYRAMMDASIGSRLLSNQRNL